jgi:hypothetical protein
MRGRLSAMSGAGLPRTRRKARSTGPYMPALRNGMKDRILCFPVGRCEGTLYGARPRRLAGVVSFGSAGMRDCATPNFSDPDSNSGAFAPTSFDVIGAHPRDRCRIRRLGARRVCLRGVWSGAGAERALSAKRSSRHQRNALAGLPDGEPHLQAWARRPIGARAVQDVACGKGSVFPGVQTGHGNRTRYFVAFDQKHAAGRC